MVDGARKAKKHLVKVVFGIASAVLLAGSLSMGAAAHCLPYQPATVTITGKGRMAFGYGPPNFGEDPAHDAKEHYVLFTVDHSFCVSGGKPVSMDEDVAYVRQLQLVYGIGQHFDQKLLGQHIQVSGQLFHRVSGGHTDVMMRVDSVKRANTKN